MLHPTLGLRLDGATLAGVDAAGGLGTPVWGPAALLRDLELRMGLTATPSTLTAAAVRVHQWGTRLAALLPTEPFYARSYRVDPIGTAEMLLAWRDNLVASGWAGTPVPDGGPRLHAFAALETLTDLPLAAGTADRLATVETEVALRTAAPYASLAFVDDRRLWPHRWQRIFDLLAERGTRITHAALAWPGAPAGSDLGRLQALMDADALAARSTTLRGDGSLVLLRAATTLEAADAVAAMIATSATSPTRSLAIVRPAQPLPLDLALARQGVAQLGVGAASPWRAALQVLPLALEMMFDPPDPRRVLELLSLAVSPFAYVTRHMMSRALADVPGIGDVRWTNAKQRLHAHLAKDGSVDDVARADREIALVEAWLEPPRHNPDDGAPTAIIVATAERVRAWLQARVASPSARVVDATALSQCDDLLAILAGEPRATLDRLAVRQLLDVATEAGATADLTIEQAGRVDHVEHPGALLCARDEIVWWHFTADAARPPHRPRWRRTELDALAACGVVPDEPAALLAEETRQWRAAVRAARRRLVLVLPATDRGAAMAPHPLWDEIVARLGLDDAQIGRLTVTVDDLRAGRRPHGDGSIELDVEALAPLALPPARPVWQVPAGMIGPAATLSSGDIEDLLGCPLRWVLGRAAALHAYSVPSLHEGPLLNGVLAHRLIDALVTSGGLTRPPAELARAIDDLLPGVAAWMLQPGMAFELHQLRHQLIAAVEALADLIARGELTVAAVEEDITGHWLGADLKGRLDLRLQDRDGRDVIVDLKWGHTSYRELLVDGRAVQLAVYAHARRMQTAAAALPAAGYFSLAQARLLTVDRDAFGGESSEAVEGPTLDRTLTRIAATVPVVQAALAAGEIPVTGVQRSLPLLESLRVRTAERDRHHASDPGQGCTYCRFDALCGKAWEGSA